MEWAAQTRHEEIYYGVVVARQVAEAQWRTCKLVQLRRPHLPLLRRWRPEVAKLRDTRLIPAVAVKTCVMTQRYPYTGMDIGAPSAG